MTEPNDVAVLVARARMASRAVYLATDSVVAADLDALLSKLADAVERLTLERDEARATVVLDHRHLNDKALRRAMTARLNVVPSRTLGERISRDSVWTTMDREGA